MKVPDGVHVRYKDGHLKDNLAVDYVMWVRDRHPIHFDREHPRLGKQLAEAQAEWGTQFLVFHTKHDKAAQAESIHAMKSTAATSAPTSTASSASVQAQVLDSPSTAQAFPAPRSAIVNSSGTQLFPSPSTAIVNSPQLAAETLLPPTTPAVSNLPPPSGFNPPFSQETSTSSVVSSNVQAFPELLSAAPIPEPSSVLLTLLLFGTAAGWKGLRSRRL
jgi:hypothetical protein